MEVAQQARGRAMWKGSNGTSQAQLQRESWQPSQRGLQHPHPDRRTLINAPPLKKLAEASECEGFSVIQTLPVAP